MKRRYHHYLKWEDFQHGMWRTLTGQERKDYLARAIEFTGNPELYGNAMLEVVERWPVSCEQNLTNVNMNRQAWIGHAACCLAIGCPEDITREAWYELTDEQRDKANAKADFAIELWRVIYEGTDSEVYKKVGS